MNGPVDRSCEDVDTADIRSWRAQMLIFGSAVTGALPRDPATRWLEGGDACSEGLFDLSEEYFRCTVLIRDGERIDPPWWHALLPAIVAGLDPQGQS